MTNIIVVPATEPLFFRPARIITEETFLVILFSSNDGFSSEPVVNGLLVGLSLIMEVVKVVLEAPEV